MARVATVQLGWPSRVEQHNRVPSRGNALFVRIAKVVLRGGQPPNLSESSSERPLAAWRPQRDELRTALVEMAA